MAHIYSRPSSCILTTCRSPSAIIITQHQRGLTHRTQRRAPITVSVPIPVPKFHKAKFHMHIMRYQSGLINGPDMVPDGAPGNFRRDNTQLMGLTGDYSRLGTQSSEYFLVDTDPDSETSPYDWPRTSGRQLRYGGRDFNPKDNLEAFGERSGPGEGPDGSACYGMM